MTKIYLVRHGKDDDTVRGGWSQAPLSEEGIRQARAFAMELDQNKEQYRIKVLYSSDLYRAVQTAEILTEALHLPIIQLPEFRETNNGDLAGMKNELADQKYPGLYWSTLSWNEPYPNGESPHEFYERIRTAWGRFEADIREKGENVMLVTHSGVISVIWHLVTEKPYSNKGKKLPIGYVAPVILELTQTADQSKWHITSNI